ncbi:hypothetical protein [Microbacterium sp. LWO12-1.2]|uniref:hypothetical protein n=1 Tax=Microbacterium sp. LWO12-1.2 TaxID=3135261 RepID=UPI00344A30FF
MPGRYVVAVGGADSAATALTWAESHAAMAGVPVVQVSVADGPSSHAPARSPGAQVAVLAPAPISQALAQFLHHDDVLVIGTGKRGFIHSRVYGARGIQIAAAVPCSIAVVPEIDLRFRRGVVAGVTSDAALAAVVDAAGAEAASRADTLQLVHSSFAGFVPGPVETAGPVLDRALAIARAHRPGLSVRSHLSTRRPAEALLDASRTAALLVIGAGTEHHLGAVAHDVLVNINAPVLLVRRTD